MVFDRDGEVLVAVAFSYTAAYVRRRCVVVEGEVNVKDKLIVCKKINDVLLPRFYRSGSVCMFDYVVVENYQFDKD